MGGPGRIRAVTLHPVLEGGQVPKPLLQRLTSRYAIDPALARDPYAWISLASYTALLEDAAQEMGDPLLGARIGGLFEPEDAGPYGALFRTSPTLSYISAHFSRLWRLVQTRTEAAFATKGGMAWCSYHVLDQSVTKRRQDAELTMAAMVQFGRQFHGASWRPLVVEFEHAASGQEAALEQLLGAPVKFGRPLNRMVFASADLGHHNRQAMQPLDQIVRRHIEDLLDQDCLPEDVLPGGFLQDVTQQISEHLKEGRAISLQGLAQTLKLSQRTLQRRLAEYGTSLRELVVAERHQLAARKLREGGGSITEIAEVLGYSDLSTFSRAYKSWTGMPPRHARHGGRN